MKTEHRDRFWKWYGIGFAVGIVACFMLAVLLIELRPAVDIEIIAAEAEPAAAVAAPATTSTAWEPPSYYPPFYVW